MLWVLKENHLISCLHWWIMKKIIKILHSKILLNKWTLVSNVRECSGSVVECLTPDGRSAGSSLTGITALCPWAGHFYPCLVLVQPRQTRPDCWLGRNESNQTNKASDVITVSHHSASFVMANDDQVSWTDNYISLLCYILQTSFFLIQSV